MTERIVVASLPAVQRDLFLARSLRRVEDAPKGISTYGVDWADMFVSFDTDAATAAATVEVDPSISIVVFSNRLESLLDCGGKSDVAATEWVLKFSARVSSYGTVAEVRRLLCDKVASLDAQTGETVGVLKLKRRSVSAGYAKVRILPAEDSLQIVCRHQTPQGLKAVWKSVLWRLSPQHGGAGPMTAQAAQDQLLAMFQSRGWSMKGYWYSYEGGVDIQIDSTSLKRVPAAPAGWSLGDQVSSGYGLEALLATVSDRPFRIVSRFGNLCLQFI